MGAASDRLVRLSEVWIAPHPRHTKKGDLIWVKGYRRHVYLKSNPTDRAIMKSADAWRESAEKHEPEATAVVQAIAKLTNGEAHGLEFRLKGVRRLREKIESDAVEQGVLPNEVPVRDALRYTLMYKHEEYASNVREALTLLERQGYRLKTKNFWQPGDSYNGLNIVLLTPGGFPMELQFHTQRSWGIAQENHRYYEEYRTMTVRGYQTDDPWEKLKLNERRRELWIQMTARADSQPFPPDIEGLPCEPEFRPFDDLPGLPALALPPSLAEGASSNPEDDDDDAR